MEENIDADVHVDDTLPSLGCSSGIKKSLHSQVTFIVGLNTGVKICYFLFRTNMNNFFYGVCANFFFTSDITAPMFSSLPAKTATNQGPSPSTRKKKMLIMK